MAKRDIIVIGASAGGVQTLQLLVSGLPADFPASIFIVLHLPAYGETQLPEILNRAGKLPAVQARNEESFERGRIYVAPPDRHLLLKGDKTIVEAGPRENFHRPAIDTLFRSAARSYGTRVIGIVLSGLLDDGTSGLLEIKNAGGITIVQDPDDAFYPQMPESALKAVKVEHQLPSGKIANILKKLVVTDAPEPIIAEKEEAVPEVGKSGAPSVYSCPDCGGVLWELQDPHLVRFRCRVGHTYGTESLSARQAEDVEKALWSALTSLEEAAGFSRRMAGRAWQRGDRHTAMHYEAKMKKAEEDAAQIRSLLYQETTVEQPVPTQETEMEPS